MKEIFVKDLPTEGSVTLFAVVAAKDQKAKKDGQNYLTLDLADRTGSLDAKLWDDVETLGALFKTGDIVKVQGTMGEYRGKPQLTVKRVRVASTDEIERGDYVQASTRPIEEMLSELDGRIDSMGTPMVRDVVRRVLADPDVSSKLRDSPAAMKLHHAFAGGLLEHVCSLLGLAEKVCDHYPSLDRDLLYAACVLHDIGKCVELDLSLKISYTVDGQLLGHVAIGYALLCKHCDLIPDFPTDLRRRLAHLILSHHGSLEHGALKIPAFPEAMVFHQLDDMDAQMDMMRKALADVAIGEEFSAWIPSMGIQVYRGV